MTYEQIVIDEEIDDKAIETMASSFAAVQSPARFLWHGVRRPGNPSSANHNDREHTGRQEFF